MSLPFKTWLLLWAIPACAQTNQSTPVHTVPTSPNVPSSYAQSTTNQSLSLSNRVEEIQTDCIQHRRVICGKILKVLPEGLVVESGYTNLMRAPLDRSWLAPGTAKAESAANLVEGDQPGCVCVGIVFITDQPKKPVAKAFDYVNLTGYPSGKYTYTSVGDIKRTVRRFSAKLPTAVEWKLEQIEKQGQGSSSRPNP